MKSGKKALSIVLLSLLYILGTLGVFSGYYTAFHRTSFQAQVKESPEEGLVRLNLTDREYEQIDWTEEESEFQWQGKMYDVSKITRTDRGYLIVCENDSLEELLMSVMDGHPGNKDGHGLKKGNPQPQLYSLGLLIRPSLSLMLQKNSTIYFLSLYRSFQPEISSPPPQG